MTARQAILVAIVLAGLPYRVVAGEPVYHEVETIDLTKPFHTKTPWKAVISAVDSKDFDQLRTDPPAKICFISPEQDPLCEEVGYDTVDDATITLLSSEPIAVKGLVLTETDNLGANFPPKGTTIWAYDSEANRFSRVLSVDERLGETRVMAQGGLSGYVICANPFYEEGEKREDGMRYRIDVYGLFAKGPFMTYEEVLEYLSITKYPDKLDTDISIIDSEVPVILQRLKAFYPTDKSLRGAAANKP